MDLINQAENIETISSLGCDSDDEEKDAHGHRDDQAVNCNDSTVYPIQFTGEDDEDLALGQES